MKKHVSPESFEGKKQRAIAVLSQYSSDDKIADLYDHDQDFSGAIIDLFSPGFEYPDYSYLTIGQALAKAKRSSEVATSEATEDICARLLDSEEHAVEGAVPGIAEEAVELIQRLWRQLQSAQCIDERHRQGHSDRKPPRSRPSWQYVCEHYGLDVSFQYTDMQKEKYYAQLSADALKNADAALPEEWKEPSDTLLGYADDNSAVEGIPPKWVRYGVYLAGTPAAIDKTHYVDTIPPTFKSWMDLAKAQAVLERGSYTLVGSGKVSLPNNKAMSLAAVQAIEEHISKGIGTRPHAEWTDRDVLDSGIIFTALAENGMDDSYESALEEIVSPIVFWRFNDESLAGRNGADAALNDLRLKAGMDRKLEAMEEIMEESRDCVSINDAIENIAEVLRGADGEYIAKIYNQICSDKLTYIGDSLFERQNEVSPSPRM